MTDRELLELAAKAAGVMIVKWLPSPLPTGTPYVWCDPLPEGARQPWNPLANDGDALRLAVKLELDVSVGMAGAVVDPFRRLPTVEEVDRNNPYAATRRAIVRAAAEIGKAMTATAR